MFPEVSVLAERRLGYAVLISQRKYRLNSPKKEAKKKDRRREKNARGEIL